MVNQNHMIQSISKYTVEKEKNDFHFFFFKFFTAHDHKVECQLNQLMRFQFGTLSHD